MVRVFRDDEQNQSFVWTPPVWQGRWLRQQTTFGRSFVFGLWCRLDRLLALMESADPRLISLPGCLPRTLTRLGGSRSDLFAITTYVALRNRVVISSDEVCVLFNDSRQPGRLT
jgi:hypothetical protein